MGIHDRAYYQDETPRGLAPSWNSQSPIAIIIMICVGTFVLNLLFKSSSGSLIDWLALYDSDLLRPWMWWRLLTYGFVHNDQGIGHLFWNMLGLWMLGRAVEERYGWAEFWRIYLSSVVICGAVWLLINGLSGGSAAVVGASGAVLTITMLFVLNFPHNTLYLFGLVPIKAWVLGLLLILGNVFIPNEWGGTAAGGNEVDRPQVAWDVHLVGLAFAGIYFYGGLRLNRLDSVLSAIRGWRRRMLGPKLRPYNPNAADADAIEADRILAKIHGSGQNSLSRKERKFLERYSRNVRQRQNS